MSDEKRRQKERLVSRDPQDDAARDAAAWAARRATGGRHADKLGQLVLIETVQCHWGGILVGIVELGGGAAIAQMCPCYWLGTTERAEGVEESLRPRKVLTTEQSPADVYLTAAVIMTLAEPEWSRVLK